MKRLIVSLVLCFFSCDYFEKQKLTTETIVAEELKTIDWNVVDEYPTFSVCDSVSGKMERKFCFESTVLNHVNAYLSEQNIIVSKDVEDSISIKMGIDNSGHISVLDIKIQPETLEIIPKLDSLLKHSIKTLPKIYPALKRGQQVNTEFILPVTISIK